MLISSYLKNSTVLPASNTTNLVLITSWYTSPVTFPTTHCAWKSISTGSWLLMTLSAKSSWSWTLKETSLRDVWGRLWGTVREAERKESRGAADCTEVVKQDEAALVLDSETPWTSFTATVQILRSSSLWAIWVSDRSKKHNSTVSYIPEGTSSASEQGSHSLKKKSHWVGDIFLCVCINVMQSKMVACKTNTQKQCT